MALLFWVLVFFIILRVLNLFLRNRGGRFARIIQWTHAMAFEAIAMPLLFALAPIGFFWKQRIGSGRRPILFIHGYGNNSVVWAFFRHKLRVLGFGPLYMMNLKGAFQPLSDYIQQVNERVAMIRTETGLKEIGIIGHSMGGVVGSLYAAKVAKHGIVTDLITIASPLKGTLIARFGIGPNAREMRRGSKVLEQLESDLKGLSKTRVFHVVTKTDQIVVPYTSEIVKGPASRRLIIRDVGHISLLFCPRVLEQIVKWLKGSL